MRLSVIKQAVSISDIHAPSDPSISAVFLAHQRIAYSGSLLDCCSMLSSLHPSALPLIDVWLQPKTGRLELLAGFRAFNLMQAAGVANIEVNVHSDLHVDDALALSLSHTLSPLLIWALDSKKSGVQISQFCKNVRAELPAAHRERVPKSNDIRKWLSLSEHIGRKSPPSKSRLQSLRTDIELTHEESAE